MKILCSILACLLVSQVSFASYLGDPTTVKGGGTGLSSVPASGKFLIGTGTGYALQSFSGDGTVSSSGVLSLTNVQGTAISGTTGTGNVVFSTSPAFTTPSLGVATATSLNKVAITAPATSSTLTIANGKTLTCSNTLTLAGTDGSTLNIGTGGTLGTAAYTASSAYEVPLTFTTGLTRTTNTVTVNTSQNITTLSNLSTNGYVKTSASNGTLVVQASPIPVGDTTNPCTAISSTTIDWSTSKCFTQSNTSTSRTFTFSNQTGGQTIVVRLTQTTGTVTWPTVKWAGGTVPTATASSSDVYTFFYDGTDTYGSAVQDMH